MLRAGVQKYLIFIECVSFATPPSKHLMYINLSNLHRNPTLNTIISSILLMSKWGSLPKVTPSLCVTLKHILVSESYSQPLTLLPASPWVRFYTAAVLHLHSSQGRKVWEMQVGVPRNYGHFWKLEQDFFSLTKKLNSVSSRSPSRILFSASSSL